MIKIGLLVREFQDVKGNDDHWAVLHVRCGPIFTFFLRFSSIKQGFSAQSRVALHLLEKVRESTYADRSFAASDQSSPKC